MKTNNAPMFYVKFMGSVMDWFEELDENSQIALLFNMFNVNVQDDKWNGFTVCDIARDIGGVDWCRHIMHPDSEEIEALLNGFFLQTV